jgi:hypothetical protein
MDVINMISKVPGLPDAPVVTGERYEFGVQYAHPPYRRGSRSTTRSCVVQQSRTRPVCSSRAERRIELHFRA